MESHKRNYSNSPFYRNILTNNNNLMETIQQSNSSQNLDSVLSGRNYLQEIKHYEQIIDGKNIIMQKLQNKINNLIIKVKNENYKNIQTYKTNEILKEQIHILNE